MKSTADRILIVRTGGLGDMVMALPALRAIRNRFKHAHLTFLTTAEAYPVIRDQITFEQVINISRVPEGIQGMFCSKRGGQLSCLLHLFRTGYDKCVILQPILSWGSSVRLSVLAYSSRSSERIGRNTDGRGFFLTGKVNEKLNSDIHEVDRQMAVAKFLGADGLTDISIVPSEDAEKKAGTLLLANEIDSSVASISVCAGSLRKNHRWPLERYADVLNSICSNTKLNILLIGTVRERELNDALLKMIRYPAVNLCGNIPLEDLPSVIKKCRLLLTNDTGPMHLAAAVGTPVVAVFGPSDIRRVEPYAPPERKRVIADHLCGSSSGFACQNPNCLYNISTDAVIKACQELL